jgi:RNA-directed DNA polymerase
LNVGISRKKASWVLDADIQGFFDSLSREWLLKFVQHRVADFRILRLIQKWLNAGVMEEGEWKDTEIGTPQGSRDFADARQYLSALRIRPLGRRLA